MLWPPCWFMLGTKYSESTPVGVIFPIYELASRNHKLPSGPGVMPIPALAGKSVATPEVVILPTLSTTCVYQRLQSGPAAIRLGPPPTEYVVSSGKTLNTGGHNPEAPALTIAWTSEPVSARLNNWNSSMMPE